MDDARLAEAARAVAARWPAARPRAGIVLGSGWTPVAEAFEVRDAMPYGEIPGLGRPGVAGHEGRLLWAAASGIETFVFQGRRHWYEGEGWTPVAVPPFLLARAGASFVVLANAAGAVDPAMQPGDLMVLTDHVNLMGSNPLIGPHRPPWGPRFPDQTQVYDPELVGLVRLAGRGLRLRLHQGVYVAVSGPTYETPAEVEAFRALGADALGMSTVPEAMLAHAAGMRVCGLSLITNVAAGAGGAPLRHEEVVAALGRAAGPLRDLVRALWAALAARLPAAPAAGGGGAP
jgi:purine-nucleoside phosphorylase